MRHYIEGANDPVPKRFNTSEDFMNSVKEKISNPTVNSLKGVASIVRQTTVGRYNKREDMSFRRLKTNRTKTDLGGSVKLTSRNTSELEQSAEKPALNRLHKSMTFNAKANQFNQTFKSQQTSLIANNTFHKHMTMIRGISESPNTKLSTSMVYMDKKIEEESCDSSDFERLESRGEQGQAKTQEKSNQLDNGNA